MAALLGPGDLAGLVFHPHVDAEFVRQRVRTGERGRREPVGDPSGQGHAGLLRETVGACERPPPESRSVVHEGVGIVDVVDRLRAVLEVQDVVRVGNRAMRTLPGCDGGDLDERAADGAAEPGHRGC